MVAPRLDLPVYPSVQNMIELVYQAVFDAKMAKMALESGIAQEYRCAQNLLKCDLHFNVDPNAPGQ